MNTRPHVVGVIWLGLCALSAVPFAAHPNPRALQLESEIAGEDVRWGASGHRITAHIAQLHLSPSAALAVSQLLGANPMALARAATWPDEIRSDPAWRHAAPWHFLTIEDEQSYPTLPSVPLSPDSIRNVVEAILYFEAVLRTGQLDRKQQREALRFLVHFVGDIHQPLHVGRGDDRGGNLIRISWFESPSNLHKVWDEHLIDQQNLSFSDYVAFLDQVPRDSILAWQESTLLDWVQESKNVRAQVYNLGERGSDTDAYHLGYTYAYRNTDLIERRLLQGGLRLAGRLNALYD